jgi:hypothetical protein
VRGIQQLPSRRSSRRSCKFVDLEHFQEKHAPRLDRGWNPIFRPKTRQRKNAKAVSVSNPCETVLGN